MFGMGVILPECTEDRECGDEEFCNTDNECEPFAIAIPDINEPECTEDIECGDAGFCNDDYICEPYPIVGPGGENPLIPNPLVPGQGER